MRKWLSSVVSWLQRCFSKAFGRRSVFAVTRAEEVNKERLRSNVLYVECRGGKDRWLHLRCPCGCGDVISLSLMTSHRPFWSLTSHEDGTVSVMPSVDKTSGCRSHFFIGASEDDVAVAQLLRDGLVADGRMHRVDERSSPDLVGMTLGDIGLGKANVRESGAICRKEGFEVVRLETPAV